MMTDGRITAWLAAWNTLQGVEHYQKAAQKQRVAPDAETVQHAVTRAAVFAQLASVSPEVGFAVGEWLRDDEQRRIDEADRQAARIAEMAQREQADASSDEDAVLDDKLANGPW